MTVETKGRVVRVTTGLNPMTYKRTPMIDLLKDDACYQVVADELHPKGLACSCGSPSAMKYGKNRNDYPMYKCKECGSYYSLLSGTPFSGSTLDAKSLYLFMRLWATGSSSREIADAIDKHPQTVAELQARVSAYRKYMVTN